MASSLHQLFCASFAELPPLQQGGVIADLLSGDEEHALATLVQHGVQHAAAQAYLAEVGLELGVH